MGSIPNRCLTGKHWRAGSSGQEAGSGARLAECLPSICEALGSSLSTTLKPDSGGTGGIRSLWLSLATRESGSHPGLLENLSGKSKKPQGWGNSCRRAGRMAMTAPAPGGLPLQLEKKKPGAGSAVRTAERRPRETEAEGADAPASRVRAPHGS